MRLIEIETWALRIIERVKKGSPVEDAAVELKATWPEAAKVARRLAAHANAARGEQILWVVGVDETRGIVGARVEELSDWFTIVRNCFDGPAPTLQDVNVDIDGKTVAALCFDTGRAPYVVKNSAFGKVAGESIEWEVPWREGTRTRSATRNEILLLLSPLRRMPKLEMLTADLSLIDGIKKVDPYLNLALSVYAIPVDNELVVFPFHKCSATLIRGGQVIANVSKVDIRPSSRKRNDGLFFRAASLASNIVPSQPQVNVRAGDEVIEATNDDVLIRGPGKLNMRACFEIAPDALRDSPTLEFVVTLTEAVSESNVSLVGAVSKQERRDNKAVWRWRKNA